MNNGNFLNRVYAPIILALAIFIGLFLLKPMYTEYLDLQAQSNSLAQSKAEKEKTLSGLINMQKMFASSGVTDVTEKVKKLNKRFIESDIMSTVMLNDFTRNTNLAQARISISSISVSKGNKLPNGLSLGQVVVGLSATSVEDLIDYITYLTQSTDYVFTIDSISLPIDTSASAPAVQSVFLSLNLGVYYYE